MATTVLPRENWLSPFAPESGLTQSTGSPVSAAADQPREPEAKKVSRMFARVVVLDFLTREMERTKEAGIQAGEIRKGLSWLTCPGPAAADSRRQTMDICKGLKWY